MEIIEGHLMPDHIHMLVSIPPKMSVSSFMGYLKGKSALMIFDKHANLKYKYGNRHFWAEGYYVSTVGIYLKEDVMIVLACHFVMYHHGILRQHSRPERGNDKEVYSGSGEK